MESAVRARLMRPTSKCEASQAKTERCAISEGFFLELRADNSKASLPSDFFAERYFKVRKRVSKKFSHARRKAKNIFHAKIDQGSKRFV